MRRASRTGVRRSDGLHGNVSDDHCRCDIDDQSAGERAIDGGNSDPAKRERNDEAPTLPRPTPKARAENHQRGRGKESGALAANGVPLGKPNRASGEKCRADFDNARHDTRQRTGRRPRTEKQERASRHNAERYGTIDGLVATTLTDSAGEIQH